MQIGMLTGADWFELEHRFPSAASWLRGRTRPGARGQRGRDTSP